MSVNKGFVNVTNCHTCTICYMHLLTSIVLVMESKLVKFTGYMIHAPPESVYQFVGTV
jgi:hypothetical protein